MSSHAEKPVRHRQELVEAIVMYPVASLVDRHRLGMLEGLDAPVFDPIARPRLGAANQQRRTRDASPDFARIAIVEHVRRGGVNVVVELPRVGAVLVAANSPDGQMERLIATEMRVGLAHASERLLD